MFSFNECLFTLTYLHLVESLCVQFIWFKCVTWEPYSTMEYCVCNASVRVLLTLLGRFFDLMVTVLLLTTFVSVYFICCLNCFTSFWEEEGSNGLKGVSQCLYRRNLYRFLPSFVLNLFCEDAAFWMKVYVSKINWKDWNCVKVVENKMRTCSQWQC